MAKKCTQLLLVGLLLLLASQSPHAQTAESYVWQSVAIRGGDLFPVWSSARLKRTFFMRAPTWPEPTVGTQPATGDPHHGLADQTR